MTATADRILSRELDFDSLERKAVKLGAPLIEQAAIAAANRMLAQQLGNSGVRHEVAFREAMLKLSGLVVRVMAFADLLARVRLVRDVKRDACEDGDKPHFGRYRMFDAAGMYARISDDLPDFLTQPWDEAIDDFAEREPVIQRSAEAVAEAYQRHQFSMAYSASLEINQQVKDMILRALQGEGGKDTGQRVPSGPGERDIKVLTPTGIEEIVSLFREQTAKGFSDNYAHVVFRTNIATAQSAGRLQMASDPDLAQFMLGWEYIARLDTATRPNHAAMHGHIAAVHAPVWKIWVPPNGYQ
jgi:SPP1 gp7 family putative phage head morphogenesis protein